MKIECISVFKVEVPLREPYWLSGGRLKFEQIDVTLLKVETDNGFIGWGDGTPWGHTYLPAHARGVRAGIAVLAPFVLGLDPRHHLILEHTMDRALPGHFYAKHPIDMACWDIAGQAAGVPIADLIGGGYREHLPIVASVGTRTIEDTRVVMNRYREEGHSRFSVKIGGDVSRDIARICAVEAERGEHDRILYDSNRGWSRAQALAVMRATENLSVMFEQPCQTLDDFAAIRPLLSSPISVDEALTTYQDGVRVVREGLAEVFNIKINRVGGLTRAIRLRDLALAHGIDLYVMSTGGSVLADAEMVHLAASVPPHALLGVWSSQDGLTMDIAGGRGPRAHRGILTLSEDSGLGVHPDESMLGDPVAVYRS